MANTFMVQLENAFKTFSADMKLFSYRHKSAIHKKDKNANWKGIKANWSYWDQGRMQGMGNEISNWKYECEDCGENLNN